MNSLIIWSDFEDLPKYYLVQGDQTKFEGAVINCMDDHPLETELNSLMYGEEGYIKLQALTTDEVLELFGINSISWIVRCGFAP